MIIDVILKLKKYEHSKETVCENYSCFHKWSMWMIPEPTKGIAKLKVPYKNDNFRTILFCNYPNMMINLSDILIEEEKGAHYVLEITELSNEDFNKIINL